MQQAFLSRRQQSSTPRRKTGKPGRVIETVGRRVRVEDAEGQRVCFLSGQRAVIGDEVLWVEAPGTGGKVVAVTERRTCLRRRDHKGREQIVAANLQGVIVVDTASAPPLAPVLLDRYITAATRDGLEVVLCINKLDLGFPDDARAQVNARTEHGFELIETSASTGQGIDDLRAVVAQGDGPWALVGRSGVGKTSLVRQLLPEQDVGPVGELSEYWGMGKHTTTSSRVFALPEGGEIVDSPGIRTFTPAGMDVQQLRQHFPAVKHLRCQYRDCLHRKDEQGCTLEDSVHPELIRSYRTLLKELVQIAAGTRRGHGEQDKKRG